MGVKKLILNYSGILKLPEDTFVILKLHYFDFITFLYFKICHMINVIKTP